MIVDFHTHIFPPRIRDNREPYLVADPGFSRLYSKMHARIATVDDLVESMDKTGVDVSVALNFAWQSHDLCVETNDYMMEAVTRYPNRVIGFCSVQPKAGDKALRELERCHKNSIRGVGEMRPDDQGFDITDTEAMHTLMELTQSLDMVLLLHASEPVGHEYPGKGGTTPEKLYKFIKAFPNQKVVLAHWGGGLPFYTLMPEVARLLSNTYFDTAATQFLYHHDIFYHVSGIVGANKILFASDYPLITQARALASVRILNIPLEEQALILGKNAEALLAPCVVE